MNVISNHFCKPANALGGLFVQIEFDRGQEEKAKKLAKKTAKQMGWDAEGRASVGGVMGHGVTTLRQCFWFHDIKGRYCGDNSVIQSSTIGEKAIYEYQSEDPRRTSAAAVCLA